jgi:hypothetical protein
MADPAFTFTVLERTAPVCALSHAGRLPSWIAPTTEGKLRMSKTCGSHSTRGGILYHPDLASQADQARHADGAATALALWGGYACTINRVGEQFFDQSVINGNDTRDGDIARIAALGVQAVLLPADPFDSVDHGPPIQISGASGTLGRAFGRICQQRKLAHRLVSRDEMATHPARHT